MEENNRKGTGVFYAVVGVATLVVAIIGATFAFFSANATNDSAITGGTAEAGGVKLDVTPVTTTGTNMIPLNLMDNTTPTNVATGAADQFADALGATKGTSCKDSNGNNVCQVYSIKVTNLSTTSTVQVRGTLTLNTEAAANMKWQLLTSGTATTRADFATVVDKGVAGDVTVGGNTGATGTAAASQTLAASGDATYYVLVWLEETGSAQETNDANKAFKGTVNFNAVDAQGNTSGLTASFSAGA